MSENKSIQLGLCCMNTKLSTLKPPIMSSRSVTLKTLETKGFEPLKEKIIQNLKDTLTLIEWNEKNGIKNYPGEFGLLESSMAKVDLDN